jgi:ketosteroid isomerase-like protein
VPGENVELHRRIAEAFNAHDREAFVALCDPDIEWNSVFAAVGGATYQGYDGIREFFADFEEAWGEAFSVEVEAYFDLGEETLAFVVLHGSGRQSGAEVAMPVAHLMRWRDGLAVYFKAYLHREDALADLGVSEDALEPIAP